MNKIQIVFLAICLFVSSGMIYGQDTVYLVKRPKVIIQSWYPEFKEFPKLRIGEGKILFTIIPDFEKTRIRDNDINLLSLNSAVNIEETDRPLHCAAGLHGFNCGGYFLFSDAECDQ